MTSSAIRSLRWHICCYQLSSPFNFLSLQVSYIHSRAPPLPLSCAVYLWSAFISAWKWKCETCRLEWACWCNIVRTEATVEARGLESFPFKLSDSKVWDSKRVLVLWDAHRRASFELLVATAAGLTASLVRLFCVCMAVKLLCVILSFRVPLRRYKEIICTISACRGEKKMAFHWKTLKQFWPPNQPVQKKK